MRITIRIITLAACLLSLATAAHAQTRSGFTLGLETFDYQYRERYEGEVIVEDDGRFWGGSIGYTKVFSNAFLVRGRLDVASGSVDYRSDETRLDDVDQSSGRFELHVGRDFRVGSATITPFAGFGVRVLLDDSFGHESEDGAYGYDRRIAYRYLPLGLGVSFPLRGATDLALSTQYNWLRGGNAESYFSDFDPAFPDVRVDLDGGSGYEASAIVSMPLGRRRLSFGPSVRAWRIDQSESFILVDPEGSGETFELFEPPNRTTEVALRVAFTF